MKQFHHLVLLGAVLVTLLFVIDTIDARKKETKRKEVETNYENEIGNSKVGKNGKLKKPENGKLEKLKKSNEYRSLNLEESLSKENNKNIGKKGKKSTKDAKKEGVNPKITKTYQKVKKYKIVEDVPAQKFNSNKKIPKKSASQETYKQEVMDEVFKSLKKTSQKKLSKEGNGKNGVKSEEPKELNVEEPIFVEEGDFGKNQKRKAYKLVEVVLEEEDENPEGNETVVEAGLEDEDDIGGIQRTESEEVIEKYKTTQTLKYPKSKKSSIYNPGNEDAEELINDDHLYDIEEQELLQNDMPLDEESYISRYEDLHDPNTLQRCKPIPEDPNRQGPKKLTLYVVEEEVDGQIKKRVVSEEDGVTMCEVADLLQEHYYSGLQ